MCSIGLIPARAVHLFSAFRSQDFGPCLPRVSQDDAMDRGAPWAFEHPIVDWKHRLSLSGTAEALAPGTLPVPKQHVSLLCLPPSHVSSISNVCLTFMLLLLISKAEDLSFHLPMAPTHFPDRPSSLSLLCSFLSPSNLTFLLCLPHLGLLTALVRHIFCSLLSSHYCFSFPSEFPPWFTSASIPEFPSESPCICYASHWCLQSQMRSGNTVRRHR